MLVLLGKAGSGKNKIQNELVKLGLETIVPYTTRPMRNKEVDGVDYHFITKDDFKKKKKQGLFVTTYSTYVTSGDIWHYGILKEDLNDNKVVILNPKMLKDLKRENIDMKVFLLNVKSQILWERLKRRGDSKKESLRRLLQDMIDFNNISNEIDFIVNNGGLRSPQDVAMTIKYFYEK